GMGTAGGERADDEPRSGVALGADEVRARGRVALGRRRADAEPRRMHRSQRSNERKFRQPVDVAGVRPALRPHQLLVQTLELEPASHQLLYLLRLGGSKADAEGQL